MKDSESRLVAYDRTSMILGWLELVLVTFAAILVVRLGGLYVELSVANTELLRELRQVTEGN